MKTSSSIRTDRRGMALVVVMGVIVLLTIAAASLHQTTRGDMQAAYSHLRYEQALMQADSGVRYVLSCFSQDLKNGMNANATTFTNYPTPTGFSFQTSPQIIRTGEEYAFSVTGTAYSARAIVAARMRRAAAVGSSGLFGHHLVYLAPNLDAYSYDSSVITNPTPATSTGEMEIGANSGLAIKSGVSVDGYFLLGPGAFWSDDYEAMYDRKLLPSDTPADPLGASTNTGTLYKAFEYRKTHNDNADAGKNNCITNDQIEVSNKSPDPVLSPGSYYLTKLDMPASAGRTLIITNATPANPVVLFVDGALDGDSVFDFSPQNVINANGRPGSLLIFYRDRSLPGEDHIKVMPNSDVRFLLYAPNTFILMQPNGDAMGMFWGLDVEIKPGGNFFMDTSLTRSLAHYYMLLTDWRIVYE